MFLLFRCHFGALTCRSCQWYKLARVVQPCLSREWLTKYSDVLSARSLDDPRLIYNMDEIIFSGSERIRKVVVLHTIDEVHAVGTDPGVHIAVIVCSNAQGELLLPPYVVKSGMSSLIAELAARREHMRGVLACTETGWVD